MSAEAAWASTFGSTGVEYSLEVAVRRGSGELIIRAREKGEEREEDLGREQSGCLIAAAFRRKDRWIMI